MEINAIYLAGFLSIAWGGAWAAFLQFHKKGQWMAIRRTYWTVIIGVGVDILILLVVLPALYVGVVALVFALSSIGIIWRSWHNEYNEDAE